MSRSSSNKRRGPKKKPSGTSKNPKRTFNRTTAQKKSTLNPGLLVKKATAAAQERFRAERSFDEMPISERLKVAIRKKGFEYPTEIQDKTLELLLQEQDLLGIAQTGTGKTGAFLIPIIEQLVQRGNPKSFALVVVPTRELALQINEEFRSLTKNLKLFSACFIGGTSINKDLLTLRRPSHIIIATPGRLIDLVDRKEIDLRKFNTLVLDEFDRMLDMGFVHDVKRIVNNMHQRQHTLLFSATIDNKQQSLIENILTEHAVVKISEGDITGDHIDQDTVIISEGQDKFQVLMDMITQKEFTKVLLFEEVKYKVSRLCERLTAAGILADQIHGDKTQNARQEALTAFKRGTIQVLVATDVAARGIDVSDVTHVINYQVPRTYEDYIHRIGRTGRAGKGGKAFTFVTI